MHRALFRQRLLMKQLQHENCASAYIRKVSILLLPAKRLRTLCSKCNRSDVVAGKLGGEPSGQGSPHTAVDFASRISRDGHRHSSKQANSGALSCIHKRAWSMLSGSLSCWCSRRSQRRNFRNSAHPVEELLNYPSLLTMFNGGMSVPDAPV